MARSSMLAATAVAILAMACATAAAHPGPAGHGAAIPSPAAIAPVVLSLQSNVDTVSGQGNLRFRVLYTSSHLPEAAASVLVKAHGGFAVDRRPGKGESYFALPGAGIIQISGDLASTRMLDTDGAMRDLNMHNATIWHDEGETPFLTFPSTDGAKVFTTSLDGQLVHTLDAPTKDNHFAPAAVNEYFAAGRAFIPTDVAYHGGRFYITTGYSPLDYVLTAKIESTSPFVARWSPLAFGGRGEGVGQFGTGHGITVTPDREAIVIADRPRSEIDRFSLEGDFQSTINLPAGSFPCDVDYLEDYTTVGCLHGPDRDKGAPIYLLKGDEVVSTVMPKEELGLANFQHIHNAVMRRVNGKLYLIVQAWNPGDFAILEQVAD